MVGLVQTIHVFLSAMRCSRRGCSPQGRAWRKLEQGRGHGFRALRCAKPRN